MANISISAAKTMLDWSLKNTDPASLAGGPFIGLSLGSPSSAASSEVGAGSGYARSSMTFSPAVTAGGAVASANNSSAQTFGPFNAVGTISGIFLSDTVSSGAGSMFWHGALAAARTPSSGDSLVLAAQALTITLS